jgi:asparaginyl-tRNA synthetase
LIKSLFNRFFAFPLTNRLFKDFNLTYQSLLSMSFNKRTKIKKLVENDLIGNEATIMGWVRTKRSNKNVTFIAINDGSTIINYQVVADPALISEDILKKVTTGACLKITGTIVASQGAGQQAELAANAIEILGEADAETYPLQPKKHSLEFLREIAHLRIRTNTFGAVFRVRHALAFAVHKYFNDKGFFYIHTPIITSSDAEGAGETFKVTTLDIKNPPLTEEGKINYKKDFFEKETNLTVSGQLEGELAAMGLAEIYTFGPTFRAENSNTARHLAEFWMIEPEMAFYDAQDNQDLAEDFLKYVISYALENCQDDLEFLDKRAAEEENTKKADQRSEMGLLERLRFVVENEFQRLTYTEAIEILRNSNHNKKKKFQYLIESWGVDLTVRA